MIVYLAGKITGNDNYKKEFKEAENKLKELGYIVLNPAKLPKGMKDEQYMPICLSMLNQADIMVLVNDMESDGVEIEKKYAEYQGKMVFSISDIEIITEKLKENVSEFAKNLVPAINNMVEKIEKAFDNI